MLEWAYVGKKEEIKRTVSRNDMASVLGSGGQDVLSTPTLVAWMEKAAVICLGVEDRPESGLCCLGAYIDIYHIAPTPPESDVVITAEIVEVDGNKYTFKCEAFNKIEKIGYGTHIRAVVDETKFNKRIEEKLAQVREAERKA